MNDEDTQRFFAMMTIAEQQQNAIELALQNLEKERQALALEREALAKQVKQIAKLTSEEVVKSLSGVPQELAASINQAGKMLLASGENAQRQIDHAAEQLERARNSLNWRLFSVMIGAMLTVIVVAFVAQWGVTRYWMTKVEEAQQSYEYWNSQAAQKFNEAKKHK